MTTRGATGATGGRRRRLAGRLLLGAHAAMLGLAASNLLYLRRTRRRRQRPAGWPRVSVLVPARNEADNLRRLLPSLAEQDYPDFEVVVVDDASEDGTWAVLEAHAGPWLRALRSTGPPPGWLGKNHALHTAAAAASGDVLLFLDADARLTDPGALSRLVERHAALGPDGVLTGLPRFIDRGPAALLTSLVPFTLLATLPLPLVPRTRIAALSALNGQVWMLSADGYRRRQPHAVCRDRVLEDVEIGRLLKRTGARVTLRDLGGEVEVEMYRSLSGAWRGFRKNAYLLAGGRPLPFLAAHAFYVGVLVGGPLADRRLFASALLLKGLTDRGGRLPIRLVPLAPLAFALGALLQLDSAWTHLTGRAEWKGRRVG